MTRKVESYAHRSWRSYLRVLLSGLPLHCRNEHERIYCTKTFPTYSLETAVVAVSISWESCIVQVCMARTLQPSLVCKQRVRVILHHVQIFVILRRQHRPKRETVTRRQRSYATLYAFGYIVRLSRSQRFTIRYGGDMRGVLWPEGWYGCLCICSTK